MPTQFWPSRRSTSIPSLVIRVYTDNTAWDGDHHRTAIAITVETVNGGASNSTSRSSKSGLSNDQRHIRRLIAQRVEAVIESTQDDTKLSEEISAEVSSLTEAKAVLLLGLEVIVHTDLPLPEESKLTSWAKDKVCILVDNTKKLIGTEEAD